jgi:virulence-associated protein VapD
MLKQVQHDGTWGNAAKALPWFPTCVRDIRAFKVEHWSDFTDFMKL